MIEAHVGEHICGTCGGTYRAMREKRAEISWYVYGCGRAE